VTAAVADYVEYGSLATVPGPLRSTGSIQWCFLLEADPDRLEALCRRVFFEPSQGALDIRPLGRHVLLTLGHIERIVSEVAPYDAMGWSSEGQSAIWVPVASVRQDGDHLVAQELFMFTPYMWVDNPISLPSGREMYGYPKSFGWATLPASVSGATSLSLDVLGMDFGRDEEPTRRPLLHLERGEKVHELGHLAWSAAIDVARHFRHAVESRPGEAVRPGLRLAQSLARDVRAGGLRQVFLHQVRSVEDTGRAALSEVTAAHYRVLSMRAAPLEHEYAVTIESLDSHPLEAELGLRSQTTRDAFRTESDFLLEAGQVLWSERTMQ
jgi:hypothetical protein